MREVGVGDTMVSAEDFETYLEKFTKEGYVLHSQHVEPIYDNQRAFVGYRILVTLVQTSTNVTSAAKSK
jgi:hypothetical protein